jgi:uncharacterized delta-60 repeat protein
MAMAAATLLLILVAAVAATAGAVGGSAKRMDSAAGVAIERDGKIVAVGWGAAADGSSSQFALARYLRNGRLDRSFGSGGKVLTGFGRGSYAKASSVVVQRDARIVVAGLRGSPPGDDVASSFAVVRYRPNGQLDRSFGAGGKVVTGFGRQTRAQATSVAIQGNGEIVVAGWWQRLDFSSWALVVVRYRRNGRLDSSFGTDGKAMILHFGRASAVAIQPDGRIVVTGGNGGFELARFNRDGSLDASFGAGGKVVSPTGCRCIGSGANAIALQSDGKIVAAGMSGRAQGRTRPCSPATCPTGDSIRPSAPAASRRSSSAFPASALRRWRSSGAARSWLPARLGY